METGFHTPLLDFFRRGEVPPDVRLLAARGALAPRAHEQLALLVLLIHDPDPEIAQTASRTLDQIPHASLAAFLARSDVGPDLRSFFAARGIEPAPVAAGDADQPLIEVEGDVPVAEGAATDDRGGQRPIALLSISERIKLAMRGTREQRAILVRDPNKLVALTVLSSPKVTETEVETFARMANVAEEVLRVIAASRTWVKNYAVASALARNPKTPPAVSLPLISRLTERDVKLIAMDRNLPEGLRIAARKAMAVTQSRKH